MTIWTGWSNGPGKTGEPKPVAENGLVLQDNGIFRTHFTCDPAMIGTVVASAIEKLTPLMASAGDVQGLEIALTEILNNIAEHAYCGSGSGPVELEVWDQNSMLKFCVLDRGVEYPNCELPAGKRANLDVAILDLPEGGFGWHLIRSLVQELKYERLDGQNSLTFEMTGSGG